MSITVKIPQQPEKLGIKEDIKLKVRKTMGDQLVVEDHPDVDIVIYPDSNKILALASIAQTKRFMTHKIVCFTSKKGRNN